MDIATKITLIASLILMGYNISEFVLSYESVCEKTEEFKKMVGDVQESTIRRSNLLLSLFLSIAFILLTYWSGLALWVTIVVAAKLVFTLCCSDLTLLHVLRVGELTKKFYMLTKVDALVNAALGFGIALIMVV